MPTANIAVTGLRDADQHLRTFAKHLADLTPFWRELAEHLANDVQQGWPLRRHSGRLRKSLTWARGRLGLGGVFEPTANRLAFGTDLFYARFAQHGTTRQRKTPLIDVDVDDARTRLSDWMRARAEASGLEVDR